MKSITIHGIDKETEKAIAARAKSQGRSVNKVVKELLGQSLGTGERQRRPDHRQDFAEFCGVWSKKEADEFFEALGDLEQIDEDDWR